MQIVFFALQKGALEKSAFLLLLFLLTVLPACAANGPRPHAPDAEDPSGAVYGQPPALAPEWRDLRARLARDGLSGPQVDELLLTLGPKVQAPMGRKMTELYKKNFMAVPRKAAPRTSAGAVYKGVVTAEHARRCRAYITAHEEAFAAAQQRYGVPSSIAVSLLFVETRLGAVLGDVNGNALHTLASMAESRSMDDISQWLHGMPGYEKHEDWFAATMEKRADWAYRETRALVSYMIDNGLRPENLPGSVYGAVGLCQFMPSNIVPYGVDGNGDGVVDLYTAEDAVASLANYLAKNGWKRGADRASHHKALMRYNKSTRYANTILALADLVDKTPAADAR